MPPPIYAPELVAKAILFAAQNPKRDLYVGGVAKLNSMVAHYTPRLADKFSERFAIKGLYKDGPKRDNSKNNLHEARGALRQRHAHNKRVLESSAYTLAATHSSATLMAIGTIGLIALATFYRKDLRLLPSARSRR